MLLNFTGLEIWAGGTLLPPVSDYELFMPILERAPGAAFDTLMGYEFPKNFEVPPPGTRVVVWLTAAAVSTALKAGLIPLVIPQKYLNQLTVASGVGVVLPSADALEVAPISSVFGFPQTPIYTPRGIRIQRMTPGDHYLRLPNGIAFPPVAQVARTFPDGTAKLPELDYMVDGVIVPPTGPCVRAARQLDLWVLVPSAVQSDGKVNLYLVG